MLRPDAAPADPGGVRRDRSRLAGAAAVACLAAWLGCDAPSGAHAAHSGPLLERGAVRAPETDRPTLVLVTLDTLNKHHLGFFGYPHATSPQLDAWLAKSVVFEEAQAASPWTLPSVASLMTGLPFSAHGAGHVRARDHYTLTPVRADVALLAEVLRAHGYATTAIVANPYFDPRRGLGLERGFDRSIVFDGKDANPTTREALERTDFSTLRSAVFEGEGSADHLLEVFQRVFGPEHRHGAFFWLHFLDPHNPYRQRDAAIRGAGITPPDAPDGTLWMDWELRHAMKAGKGELVGAEREDVVRAYDGEVAFLDAALGRLFARLAEVLPADAWVALTSDHGEELWEHGSVDHDHTLYQELVGSFVAFRGAGVPARREREVVRHVDVFATLCGLARVVCPAPPPAAAAFAGRDLFAAPPAGPVPAVSENNLTNPSLAAIRTGDEKYILHLATGRYELYDLAVDPEERFPRRDPARHAELRAQLERLRALARDPGEVAEPDAALQERLRRLGYLE